MTAVKKNPHAVALGRLGGLSRSAAKVLAVRENGKKGGHHSLFKNKDKAAK